MTPDKLARLQQHGAMVVIGVGADAALRQFEEADAKGDATMVPYGCKTATALNLPDVTLPECLMKFNFRVTAPLNGAELQALGQTFNGFIIWPSPNNLPEFTIFNSPQHPTDFGILLHWKNSVAASDCVSIAK